MRRVSITATGPLGWSDWIEIFHEDDLLLTASGKVLQVRRLKEGDTLIRFTELQKFDVQHWIITKIVYMRRERVYKKAQNILDNILRLVRESLCEAIF